MWVVLAMIWLASVGFSIGSCDRSSSYPPAAWVPDNFRRFPLARMTSCCVAWPPSRKASGRNGRGYSWCFAVSLGSTSDLLRTPGATSSSLYWPEPARASGGADSLSAKAGQAEPAIPWLCAALVGGQTYLFDARVGLPVPGPDGQGVATLNQALADPAILERMDLPGQSPYGTSRASLLASPSRIGILDQIQ